MTLSELQAVSEAIANQAERKLAARREALIVLDGRAWNVRVDGLPLFYFPTDHAAALAVADAINAEVTQ
jgi:hypothetical protein